VFHHDSAHVVARETSIEIVLKKSWAVKRFRLICRGDDLRTTVTRRRPTFCTANDWNSSFRCEQFHKTLRIFIIFVWDKCRGW